MIISELGGLLLEVVKDGFLSLTFVDFAQAKQTWTVPLIKEKSGGIGLGALNRAIKNSGNSAFNVAPKVDAEGNLLFVIKKEVFCISKAGTLAWKKEFDDNVDDAYLSSDKKALFIGYKKYIDKLNTVDGNSQLKEAIKMKDALNGIEQMGEDYIVYNEKGINIMTLDGLMKWKKDASVGNITQVKYDKNGILSVEGDDKDTKLIWVDLNGKEQWSEKINGGLILAELTEKGVMYVTTERANILTYDKGKEVWKKDIKIKGKPFFGMDNENKIVYAYAKDDLHAFNFNDVTHKLVAENVELKRFKEKEERLDIEIRDKGATVYIVSAQSFAAVNVADGKILHNESFKEIGFSRKRLMKFAGAAFKVAGAAIGASQLSKGNLSSFSANNDFTIVKQLAGTGSELLTEARNRHLLTLLTKDNLYILSQMPEGNGMLIWSKVSGKIVKKITFDDITPQYIVDEATDRVYVIVGNVIKAYSLK